MWLEITLAVVVAMVVAACWLMWSAQREALFWRGAFISASDTAFLIFDDMNDAVEVLIGSGVDQDQIPYPLLRVGDDKSARERFKDHIKALAQQCGRRRYQWMSTRDLAGAWLD